MAEGLEADGNATSAAVAPPIAASGVGNVTGGQADAREARAAAAQVLLLELCECRGDGVGGGAAPASSRSADDAAEASAVRGIGVVGEHGVEGGGFAELAELFVQLSLSALHLFGHTEEAVFAKQLEPRWRRRIRGAAAAATAVTFPCVNARCIIAAASCSC